MNDRLNADFPEMPESAISANSLRRIVMDCNDRCADPDMHDHFTGRPFKWDWPTFTVLHPAVPRTGFVLNRYPHNVIGVAFYWRTRGVGVRWKGTP